MPNRSGSNGDKMNSIEDVKQTLKKLDTEKTALESEAEAIVSELTSPGEDGEEPMGVDTPLVDMDGYPRANIDLVRARTLRHRLAEIRTDHKEIVNQIEEGLKQLKVLSSPLIKDQEQAELAARRAPKPKPTFDQKSGKWVVHNWDGSTVAGPSALRLNGSGPVGGDRPTNSAPAGRPQAGLATPHVPFAVVDGVASHSPAESAGLREGDLVIKFGHLDYTNHDHFKELAELVPLAAGNQAEIDVVVLRRRTPSVALEDEHGVEAAVHIVRELKILPRPWGGRGLLGCHILAYTESTQAQYHEPAVSS